MIYKLYYGQDPEAIYKFYNTTNPSDVIIGWNEQLGDGRLYHGCYLVSNPSQTKSLLVTTLPNNYFRVEEVME